MLIHFDFLTFDIGAVAHESCFSDVVAFDFGQAHTKAASALELSGISTEALPGPGAPPTEVVSFVSVRPLPNQSRIVSFE